ERGENEPLRPLGQLDAKEAEEPHDRGREPDEDEVELRVDDEHLDAEQADPEDHPRPPRHPSTSARSARHPCTPCTLTDPKVTYCWRPDVGASLRGSSCHSRNSPMTSAFLAFALLPAAVLAGDAGLPQAQQELFDTERAFVRLAAEKGFRDSFYAYFADDGIAFNPHPFRVRTALAGQPASPGPMGATWAPVYGDIAQAGDLGWDTGPLEFEGR